jgi:DNA polymerase II small subunit
MLDAASIVQRFLDTKLQVHPDVVRYISERGDPSLIDQILGDIPPDAVVVSPRHIPGMVPMVRDGARFLTDPQVEVVWGSAGSTGGVSSLENYSRFFRHRYDTLGGMIRGRMNGIPIEAVLKNSRYRQEETSIIGMVADVRTSTKGHRMIDLEDPTGTIPVLFNKNREGFGEAEKVLPDEVIGVRGKLSQEGKLFFAESLIRPDVPNSNAPFMSPEPGKAVLISDIHVGSNTFLPEAWGRFAAWLEDSDVSYLLIAGDAVDGIGIYPGQESELVIPNIYEQYEKLGDMLSALPPHIRIILGPGNHDVVRGAEPQPCIPEQFRSHFPKNCTFVENPAFVRLQGVGVLMYHGRSIDDMVASIPGASYERAGDMMEEMAKRRLLAASYGKRTPIAAHEQDRLLIDPIPEVLHTGHVHVMGITSYRGVLCVNAGTWQSQTAFQKQMNLVPTPGRAVLLDLQTLRPEVLDFS